MPVAIRRSIGLGEGQRYESLADLFEKTGLKKWRVAVALGIAPWFLTELLDPKKYDPLVTDELCALIAELLNQSKSYVRTQYRRAA